MHPRLLIPLNSILVTYGFTILLSLINLGSTVALYVFHIPSVAPETSLTFIVMPLSRCSC